MKKYLWIFVLGISLVACQNTSTPPATEQKEETTPTDEATTPAKLTYEQEKNLVNLKQLTFGGDNAEAYFSFDNSKLVFQASNDKWGAACDQIFYMSTNGYEGDQPPLLSTGKGRTTCSYFMPGDSTILYASTHLGNEACPDAPRTVNGKYVWPIFADFDIFVADLEGNIVKQLTDDPGYDAEATLSPDGKNGCFYFNALR